jgi:predicted RNA-binding Zn-ribbon protein involved in translation (DUF1610 family)
VAEVLIHDPARLHQLQTIRDWVEDADSMVELDELLADLDQLRQPQQASFASTAWWCLGCKRILVADEDFDNDGDCAHCGSDEIYEATRWRQLSSIFSAAPSLPGSTPTLAIPSGDHYLGTCGCHSTRLALPGLAVVDRRDLSPPWAGALAPHPPPPTAATT